MGHSRLSWAGADVPGHSPALRCNRGGGVGSDAPPGDQWALQGTFAAPRRSRQPSAARAVQFPTQPAAGQSPAPNGPSHPRRPLPGSARGRTGTEKTRLRGAPPRETPPAGMSAAVGCALELSCPVRARSLTADWSHAADMAPSNDGVRFGYFPKRGPGPQLPDTTLAGKYPPLTSADPDKTHARARARPRPEQHAFGPDGQYITSSGLSNYSIFNPVSPS